MGNHTSTCLPLGSGKESKAFSEHSNVDTLLRKRYAHGDTCLMRCLRESPDSASARKALEAQHETVHSQLALPASSLQKSWIKLLDAQNHKGETCLHVAASLGYVDCVAYLLQQGANPWLQDRLGGHTALHCACLQGRTDLIKVMLDELPAQWLTKPDNVNVRYVECTTISGFTPFLCAVGSKNIQTVKAVLAHNPQTQVYSQHNSWEYNMEYPAHSSALHIAASKGCQEMVEFLLMRYYHSARRAFPDPRLVRNARGELPWHVVSTTLPTSMLSELVHPSFPLSVIFPSVDIIPSAQALASAALRQGLLNALDQAQQAQSQALKRQALAKQTGCASPTLTDTAHSTPLPTVITTLGPDSSSWSTANQTDLFAVCNALCPPDAHSCGSSEPLFIDGDRSSHGRRVAMLKKVLSRQRSQRPSAQGDEDKMCSICLDRDACLAVKPCSHKVCPDCARQMVQGMAMKPIDCPFCRKHISGFVYSA